ncbi:MAG: phosphoglucomutase (alpha-D-glucose-1,6-bisphosphate-dependent) [Desulfomicrobiaceae bacterium]
MHPLAGKTPPESYRINIPRLVTQYYTTTPDPDDPGQRVAFGTSGHRGSAAHASFTERHVAAIVQAICEYRQSQGTRGPLFVGMDTHALSEPALVTTLEVLAGNAVACCYQEGFGYTPTPVISHTILAYNRSHSDQADGIVITPSHNPPEDGGIKYNPPHGGPAGTEVTKAIEARANALLAQPQAIRRLPWSRALASSWCRPFDFVTPYVEGLRAVVAMDRIREAGICVGVDPLGGSSLAYWERIAEVYGVDLQLVSRTIDPTFMFMAVDKDGKLRMDCSSPAAMAPLVGLKDRFALGLANDPDADRHGIVTQRHGLMNPNHYLAVAVDYLLTHRPGWPQGARIGKTLVTSAMVDRVAAAHGRSVYETPVGFKWFVEGLLAGDLCFGGEESAGASFLAMDGAPWSTDKDGIILGLLAAEIRAVTGVDPGDIYRDLEARHGAACYRRMDAPASRAQKEALMRLRPEDVQARELAGEPIEAVLTHAPGNGASIGGLKVVTASGWFAARPSGTEDVYKIYAESFAGEAHLARLQQEAQALVAAAFARAGI